eukprot:COSAG02_NODE_7591_length_2944_cov_1.834095_5_plen_85_part_00
MENRQKCAPIEESQHLRTGFGDSAGAKAVVLPPAQSSELSSESAVGPHSQDSISGSDAPGTAAVHGATKKLTMTTARDRAPPLV